MQVAPDQRQYMEMHTASHAVSAVRLPLNRFFVKQKRTWRFVQYKLIQYSTNGLAADGTSWTDGRTDGRPAHRTLSLLHIKCIKMQNFTAPEHTTITNFSLLYIRSTQNKIILNLQLLKTGCLTDTWSTSTFTNVHRRWQPTLPLRSGCTVQYAEQVFTNWTKRLEQKKKIYRYVNCYE